MGCTVALYAGDDRHDTAIRIPARRLRTSVCIGCICNYNPAQFSNTLVTLQWARIGFGAARERARRVAVLERNDRDANDWDYFLRDIAFLSPSRFLRLFLFLFRLGASRLAATNIDEPAWALFIRALLFLLSFVWDSWESCHIALRPDLDKERIQTRHFKEL